MQSFTWELCDASCRESTGSVSRPGATTTALAADFDGKCLIVDISKVDISKLSCTSERRRQLKWRIAAAGNITLKATPEGFAKRSSQAGAAVGREAVGTLRDNNMSVVI
jgi:hypothetical protein